MTTAPNTSSSTSSQYTRRIIARQRSIDSQEEPNDEPDPQADQSEQSIGTGSLEDYYLLIDPQYNIDESITTPPPIADPPSDASYDESFIEMVKQTVQRARIAYAESHPNEENDDQESISNYLNSQASVVLSSQDSNQPNNDVYDNEARVEQARRDVDPQYDDIPLPYYLKEEQESSQKLIDSQMSLPEFAIIKKNSNTVNEVEYVTNKKPEKKETEKEERAADDARSYFERERDLYKNAIKELAQWKQEEEEEEEGSSTDYSSWLCFDNETEVAQFKDIIYNENSKGKVQVAVEEDSIPKINSDDDDDAISTLAPTMSPNSQPSSRQCSLTHRYSSLRHYSSPPQQIEQDQALIISPYRDQLKQKQKQSINEGDSSSLGSFRDKIIMQSTPVHQSQLVHGLKSSKKNTSEKKRTEDVDSLFGSDQEVEERRAALFDRVKELQPIPDSPPRQPFFNLRK